MKRLLLSFAAAIAAISLIAAVVPKKKVPSITWTTTTIATTGGSSPQLLANPLSKIIGDFNDDGEIDVALAGGKPLQQSVTSGIYFWSRDLGSSWTRYAVYVPQNSENWGTNGASADLNGDGRDDIIACKDAAGYGYTASLYWFEQETNGTWTQHLISSSMWTHDCIVADFDNDGKIDVATIGTHDGYTPSNCGQGWSYTSRLRIAFNDNADNDSWTVVSLWADPWDHCNTSGSYFHEGLAAGVIEGNAGYPDIVQGCYWFKNPATNSNPRTPANWTQHRFAGDRDDTSSGPNVRSNCIADIDGDGRNDILMANGESEDQTYGGDLRLYMNPASSRTSTWSTVHTINLEFPAVIGMLHGIKVVPNYSSGNAPLIITAEQEQSTLNNRVLCWEVSWSGGNPTFTPEHPDVNNVSGHEVQAWTEGSDIFVMTANHALQGGTPELRIYKGQ